MRYLLIALILIFTIISPAAAQDICDSEQLLSDIDDRLRDIRAAVSAGASKVGILNQIDVISDAIDACGSAGQASSITTIRNMYVVGTSGINVRAEPSTSAAVVGAARGGNVIETTGTVTGQSVSGSTSWYRVNFGSETGYIHSSLLTTTRPQAPAPQQPPASNTTNTTNQSAAPVIQPTVAPAQPTAVPPQTNTIRPDNCDHARAMGLSAVEAAKWPHLDRDKDGVACYGD